jgi:carboxyl-terminal processing protease
MSLRSSFQSCWRRRSITAVLGLAALAALLFPLQGDELGGPSPKDRRIALLVHSRLKDLHLSKHPLNDEISERAIKSLVRRLDPFKLYFLQADVDEFNANKHEMDDMVTKGDVTFIYTIFTRLLQRIDERVLVANELIDEEHDFTADEEMISDPEDVIYATNAAEARERWRKRIKYNILSLKSEEMEGEKVMERLHRRYTSFAKQMHQTSSDELLEMFLNSVANSYDPHTSYMSPSTLENFRIQMRLELEGIGAALQLIDGYTVVSRVIPGGAADLNGKLKAQDRIVSVGQGEEGEMEDVLDMKLDAVVSRIRGKAGTVVRLGVIVENGDTEIYNITRAKISLTDSEARGTIIEHELGSGDATLKVGVIDLPSFYMDMQAASRGDKNYKSTTRDVQVILDDFASKNVAVVVLDLSQNGGGSLTEAINLTGLFIDTGPVVQVKGPDGKVEKYEDVAKGMGWNGPLVVLTSRFSASASEILAGAIRDYQRGLIVGDESTHGKGTVQSLMDLGSQLFGINNGPNLGALKLTMQQFYRPNGESTQMRGVPSDVVLPSITDHMKIREGDLDYAVAFDKVDSATDVNLGMLDNALIERLRRRSQKRVGKSEEFAGLLEDIERYKVQRDRKTVTINEEKYLAERAQFDVESENRRQLEKRNDSDDDVFADTFYNTEVLDITADYVELLGGRKVAGAP